MKKARKEIIEDIHVAIDDLQELYGDIEGIEVYLRRVPFENGTTTEIERFNILYNNREDILTHEDK